MRECEKDKRNFLKAVVVVAVAIAFILPGATAVANVGTIGVISNSENTSDIKNIIEPTTDDSYIDILDTETDTLDITTGPLPTTGNIIYVDDDNTAGPWDGTWEHPYQYIKDGISNANPGDSIYVLNGIYYEYNIQVNKQLDITGQSRENTIIDGQAKSNDVIKITADYVNISTFTVRKSYKYGSNNINVYKVSNFIIRNCDINNSLGKGDGIEVYYSTGSTDIINCEVYNTQFGIYIMSPANPTRIIDCTTHDNSGNGIQLKYYYSSVAPFLVENCTSYNNAGSGIYVDSMKEGDVIGCTAYNNKYSGISVSNTDYVNFVNCTTYNNTKEGIKMGSGYNDPENCNITTCTSYNNSYGITLDAIDCILTGNTMYDNGCNFAIEGYLNHRIDPTNTVNGKPIWYLVEQENITLDETYNFGFLGLVSCNNITAKNSVAEGVAIAYTTNTTLYNITVSGADTGFYFYGGSNIKIEKCTASGNNEYGFYIYYTDNLEITECAATNMLKGSSAFAFHVEGSPGVNITNCIAHDVGPSYGFKIYGCPNANLVNCQAYNGGPTWATGIASYASPYSNIINCTVHHFQRGFTLRYDSPFTNLTDCTVYSTTYEGFEADADDCNYLNCTAYNNGGSGGGGFSPSKARNTFTNCKSYNNQHGVGMYGASENTFTNCEFYNNSGLGIDLHSTSHSNTFTNCKSYNNTGLPDSYGHPCGYGVIIIGNSYGNVFTNCEVYNNNYGFHIEDSPNTILRNTIINNNNHSFEVTGTAITAYYQDINESNTIDGKPIYYLVDKENMTIDETSTFAYLILISCDNMTLKNFDIPDLMLIQMTNSTLSNIDIHDNEKVYIRKSYSYRGKDGIYLWESPDNDVTGCTIYNGTRHGIYLQDSSNNDISSCTIYNNTGHGIYLLNSPNSDIADCTVYDNNYGIYFSTSPNSNLADCMVYDNNYGIYLSASSNNILKNNTLTGNTVGFGITGVATADFYQDIDASNTINGKPIYYLVDDSDTTIDETSNFGYLILVSCDNMTLRNLDIADLFIIQTTNSTLSNIETHDGKDGIYLWGSSYNDIVGCIAYNNTGCGIYLRDSQNNDLTDCMLYGNSKGIYLSGSSDNTIESCDSYNNGNGFYLTGSSGNTIESCDSYNNGNGFYLVSSPNNDITDCTAYSNTQGIYLSSSSDNNIMNCDVYSNSNGFYLLSSNNNNIIGCDSYSNSKGFYLKTSSYCVIEYCDIYDNPNGIYIEGTYSISARYNTIKECKIHGSSNGIYFKYKEEYNTIVNCTIWNNNNGIYYKGSYTKYNKAYHNTLGSNTKNAYVYKTPNYWDDGYPSGGNYWDDYSGIDNFSGPSQNITGSDGIGDTPYVSGKVTDNYPLMDTPGWIPPPEITDVAAIPDVQNTTEPVNITCTVKRTIMDVDTVKVHVDGPEGFTLEETMNVNGSNYWYEDIYATRGVYNYYIWANDTLGNEGISGTYSFVISDLETPTSAVNPLPSWTNNIPFTVTATAFDNTGVENVTLWSRYSSNETDWTNWTAYVTDEGEPWSWAFTTGEGDGYYEFYSIAVDDYGNVEEPPNVTDASCGLDTVPPVTIIVPNGTIGGDGWYTSSVIVTLSATDELSGVESTWYQIDSGYWKLYNTPFTVSGDGRHTVYYYSFDNAGNREDTKSADIKIDMTPPVTEHEFEGIIGEDGWFVSNVTITLSAEDEMPFVLRTINRDSSGVNYTMYKVDDGEWTTYVDPFVVAEDGDHTLYYYSVDLAGNIEPTNSLSKRQV